jgi:hypothetical protein
MVLCSRLDLRRLDRHQWDGRWDVFFGVLVAVLPHNKPFRRALLYVLAYIILVSIVSPLVFNRRLRSFQTASFDAKAAAIGAFARDHRDRIFLQINRPEFQTELIRSTSAQCAGMPKQQSQKLLSALKDFFAAYNQGDFESYIRFKGRITPMSFNFGGVVAGLLNDLAKMGNEISNNPDTRARQIWDYVTDANRQGKASTIRSVEMYSLTMTTLSTDQPKSDITSLAAGKIANTLVLPCNTMEQYPHNLPNEVIDRHNTLEVVIVYFVAQVSTTMRPIPFHVSFYWIPETADWAPWQLVHDSSAGIDFRIIF